MYLKRLELQGYKTFATKTDFVFEAGITAIVGPNGSGKSNIADAIRWVLGEQSFRLLRGKRTEDMIFSGTQRRARAGMAQVTIVLDNQDGQLPIDFSEVAIGRRAYRSGENEYLLNGSRVRLRDINELLSASGLGQRTYNVIGQGLVDAALSLRADERRKLFEEAAGISLFKERREETLAKLESTRRNLERVVDIVNEIQPRMRRLERQAIRSREYEQVRKDLENLLYLWYGYHWEVSKQQLRDARTLTSQRSVTLGKLRDVQSTLEKQITERRSESNNLRAHLGDLHHRNSELHQKAESLQRNLAVHIERMRLLGEQQEELDIELASLISRREEVIKVYEGAESDWTHSNELWKEQQAAVQSARSRLEICRRDVDALREQEQSGQRSLARLESQVASLNNRQTQLIRQTAELDAERETTQDVLEQKTSAQIEAQDQLDKIQSAIDIISIRLAELEERRNALRARRQEAQTEIKRLAAASQTARNSLAELEAQRRALIDVRDRGVGHDAAIQLVMSHRDRPEGILGPVAQLLRVPVEYESAISAVLAGNLSALVVRDRSTAMSVMELLTQATTGGRLTLLPSADLQPLTLDRMILPDDPDLIGVAGDLVSCDPAHQPVLDLLLGHVILVRNRDAAYRFALQLPRGGQAVSLDGHVAAQDGRMVLDQKGDDALLAQERSWRMLPERIKKAADSSSKADQAQASAQTLLEEIERDLEEIETISNQERETSQEINGQREGARLQLDRLTQSITWHHERLEEISMQAERWQSELVQVRDQVKELEEKQSELHAQSRQIKVDLADLPLQELGQELSIQEQALAQTSGVKQNQQVIVNTHRAALGHLESQITGRQKRIKAISQERKELTKQTEKERKSGRTLAEQIKVVSEQIAPADTQLAASEDDLDRLLAEDQEQRRQVRQAEQSANIAELSLDRAKNELDHLRTRISDELGLVHLPLDDDIEGQTPLPLGEVVGQLPIVSELSPDLGTAIQRRKQQLTRMGAINPDAPAEYAELEQRYRFLSEQTADLREADAKLRQVIQELDEVMERDFRRTFKAVAAEFRESFVRLFGGGSARLILTNPEDPIHSGVEIIARPPERRQQGLALLSGGERSLTAAALIFALLKVSPTPFCVLDEVDAMLDEANVGRFREMLSELSTETQFIVITHNRGTVQSADTIYGVSMKADGVSQIISLRLDGEQLALPEPAPVEV